MARSTFSVLLELLPVALASFIVVVIIAVVVGVVVSVLVSNFARDTLVIEQR